MSIQEYLGRDCSHYGVLTSPLDAVRYGMV